MITSPTAQDFRANTVVDINNLDKYYRTIICPMFEAMSNQGKYEHYLYIVEMFSEQEVISFLRDKGFSVKKEPDSDRCVTVSWEGKKSGADINHQAHRWLMENSSYLYDLIEYSFYNSENNNTVAFIFRHLSMALAFPEDCIYYWSKVLSCIYGVEISDRNNLHTAYSKHVAVTYDNEPKEIF